jgi:hypothetical protein
LSNVSPLSDIRNSLDNSRQSLDSKSPRMSVEVMPGWDRQPEWSLQVL